MEEKFDEFVENVTKRLDNLEAKLSDRALYSCNETLSASAPPFEPQIPRSPASHVEPVAPGPAQACASGRVDIQGDFQALRDSLARIKLPAEFRLNESRHGIKRTDQGVLNVITKCSRYNETAIRLLSTIEADTTISQDTLDQLLTIFHAQCKYLQDEYAALLVNGQFDDSTSRLFRALQRNTSG